MITFNEWLIQEGKGKKGKNMKTVTSPKDKGKYTPVTGEIDQTKVGTGHKGKIGGGAGVHGPTKNNKNPRNNDLTRKYKSGKGED
jgi:hypothetical protein